MTAEMGRLSGMCERELEDDEHLVLSVTKQKVSAVIKREFDNLTKEEIKTHAKLVNEAKLDELKTWHSLTCFRRMTRHKARN